MSYLIRSIKLDLLIMLIYTLSWNILLNMCAQFPHLNFLLLFNTKIPIPSLLILCGGGAPERLGLLTFSGIEQILFRIRETSTDSSTLIKSQLFDVIWDILIHLGLRDAVIFLLIKNIPLHRAVIHSLKHEHRHVTCMTMLL